MPEITFEPGKERGYQKKTVEEIVRRLKKMYIERGLTEEEAGKKALKLAVTGRRAVEIETRGPEELVLSKNPLYRLVGQVYKALPFLKGIIDKLSEKDLSVNLMRNLDSANIQLSTKQYLAISIVLSILASFFISLLVFVSFTLSSLLDGLLYGILTFLISIPAAFFFSVIYPSSVAKKRGREIDKVLPFALRHMATEVRAGVGIHDAMKDIAKSDYGALSQEFKRVLDDIEKGTTTTDAIEALAERSPSDALARAALQIVRALKIGGNLADILSQIADDVAFDLRMRMRDFVERLSLVALFYMMLGIVMPVFFSVLAGIFNAVPTLGFQGIIGPEVMMLVYVLLIPMTLGLILYIIKVTQPM